MSRRARLVEAGPRARLPERRAVGAECADRTLTGPVRTCVGCRARGHRAALLRVVRTTTGDTVLAVVDPGRSRPGRGAWLHADPHCLDLAERRRAFPRALRTGPLDTTPVRRFVEQGRSVVDPVARTSFIEKESGLEADGHPMSTQR